MGRGRKGLGRATDEKISTVYVDGVTNAAPGTVSFFIVPPPISLNSLQTGQCLIHLCFPSTQQDA